MKRADLLRTKEYWTVQIQHLLFKLIEDYRKEKGLSKAALAKELGVTRGYITQILNGDFDHKISKLVELALAFNKAPILHFCDLRQYIEDDKNDKIGNRHLRPIHFIHINDSVSSKNVEEETKSYKSNTSDQLYYNQMFSSKRLSSTTQG